jgi:o-succinylbenzoate synthase
MVLVIIFLNMLKASYQPYKLIFKTPGGTSRGTLSHKTSWIISLWKDTHPGIKGIGECSVLPGLSPDDHPELEQKIKETCDNIHQLIHIFSQQSSDNSTSQDEEIPTAGFHKSLAQWPALRFAIETALIDLKQQGKQILFPSDFTKGKAGILINGLIWMGSPQKMNHQIEEKLNAGFKCLKIKIGAIDFNEEENILKALRKRFSRNDLELRVDANGAFSPDKALEILKKLAQLDIHSIEQPIRPGQWQEMARLCKTSPLPIALDEELIGISEPSRKDEMISTIQPQYIILKPSLTGGFQASNQWIDTARKTNTSWWITSALESNIGLNAIAQWTYTLNNPLPQGLGTGQVFANNIDTGLSITKGCLWKSNLK